MGMGKVQSKKADKRNVEQKCWQQPNEIVSLPDKFYMQKRTIILSISKLDKTQPTI